MVALVDAAGRLARFELLPGQRHESLAAEGLLSGVSFGALLADRGFDSDALRDSLDERGAEAVIPPKSNRKKAIRLGHGQVPEAAPRGELLLQDQVFPPHRHPLRPDRVELRRVDLGRRRRGRP